MNDDQKTHAHGVDYETVGEDYFSGRELDHGAAGWLLLAGLGVAAVISGDFAGWNFGLGQGGWGGLMIATIVIAVMYLCMMFSLAELSTAIPSSGGSYAFARRAFGPLGGFMAGTAVALSATVGPAAIVSFIGAYTKGVFGVGGWPVYLVCYLVFVGIHLFGVGEALRLMFIITAIAVLALLTFSVAMIPHFHVENLFDIPVQTGTAGASPFLPFGYVGIWAAIPYAIWFLIGMEGIALAAEETPNPKRNMPRAMLTAFFVLFALASLVLVLGPGGAGAQAIKAAGNPLTAALNSGRAYGEGNRLSVFISMIALSGLIASFFSVIFLYSRQIFSLSRAGYLPRFLSRTGRHKTPIYALTLPALIGFTLALIQVGEMLVLMAVFGMSISWIMSLSSHIVLRIREPEMARPFRTPGGIMTSSIALILAIVAFVAGFLVDPKVILSFGAAYLLLILYFALYSRHHLVAQAPEEEFEAVARAQEELKS